MAQLRGVLLPPDLGEFRPAMPEEKSGRAIEADSRHLHHVEQTEPKSRDLVDARARHVGAGNADYCKVMYDEAVRLIRGLFQEAAEKGYHLDFGVSKADR
jgi:hypothetical protein